MLVKDLSASTRGSTLKSVKLSKTEDLLESEELLRLDEQIVELRKRHDKLHDSNSRKRKELDGLADKLKDLHNSSYKADESPQEKLRSMEEKLCKCAERYDEEHRNKMTYEQAPPFAFCGAGALNVPCGGNVGAAERRSAEGCRAVQGGQCRGVWCQLQLLCAAGARGASAPAALARAWRRRRSAAAAHVERTPRDVGDRERTLPPRR